MDLKIPPFSELQEKYNAYLLTKNKAINGFDPIYEAITALQSNDTPPPLLF